MGFLGTQFAAICLCFGCILKPIFIVLHFKTEFFLMYAIAIDLICKYKAKATARRR